MHTITPSFVGFAKAPWNKGRLIGQKRPLRPREVWAIRVRLQLEKRKRDLALFNLAIDSKLRGCNLVQLRVNDVCIGGRVQDRATIIQRKTGRPVQFEITEQTRAAIRDRLADTAPGNSQYLFPSRFHDQPHLSTRQYARIVHSWVECAGLGIWNALDAADKAGADLQEGRQPEAGAAASGTREGSKVRSAIGIEG